MQWLQSQHNTSQLKKHSWNQWWEQAICRIEKSEQIVWWMNERGSEEREPWKKGWGSERRKIIMEILLNPSCNCRMKIKRETGLKTKHTTLQYKVFGQITRDDGKYSLSKRGDLQITLKTWRLCCHSSPTLSKANTWQSVTMTSSLTESDFSGNTWECLLNSIEETDKG